MIGPAPVPASDGCEAVLWVDDPDNAAVTAMSDVSDVEFVAPCEGVRFEGRWGEIPNQGGRFFGYFTVAGIQISMPGALAVNAEADSLSFVLSDVGGSQVIGPLPLRRAESPPTMAACPAGSVAPQAGTTFW